MTFTIHYDSPWPTVDNMAQDARLVGQSDRTWMIPLVHSTLANPKGSHHWPRYEKATNLPNACAYWEGAYYLLAVLLGWSDIGLGLRRLYESKSPAVESPELDLLQQVWNDRGQLDLFALWAWHRGVVVCGNDLTQRTPEEFRGGEWYRSLLQRHPGPGISYDHDPYHGGINPLHLGHCLGAMEVVGGGQLVHSSPKERRAVLLLERAIGWYSALERIDLPALDDRSWRVDVVVRPLGWLGTFRQSRETRRWFTGKHSVHALGFR